MKEQLTIDILQSMLPYLNQGQSKQLQIVLDKVLLAYDVVVSEGADSEDNLNYLEMFISAKRIEGCSKKTIKYYESTILAMLDSLNKCVRYISTDDIRGYLTEYHHKKGSSKVTIDNMRRILSSFFYMVRR